MIRQTPVLDELEGRRIAEGDFSQADALQIYEAPHAEVVSLGAIGPEIILDGLEIDLRIARATCGLVL